MILFSVSCNKSLVAGGCLATSFGNKLATKIMKKCSMISIGQQKATNWQHVYNNKATRQHPLYSKGVAICCAAGNR
jgi:hypothetical protein